MVETVGYLSLDDLGVHARDSNFSSRGLRPRGRRLRPRTDRATRCFSGSLGILRWALAFLAVTLAHNLLYYLAPNARIPFKWITPGGFTATVLILVSSAALNLYVVNFARYNQIYGQVGAIIVLMVWLYSTGLMVLIGAEMNAVLTRMAEERKDIEIVQEESSGNEKDG